MKKILIVVFFATIAVLATIWFSQPAKNPEKANNDTQPVSPTVPISTEGNLPKIQPIPNQKEIDGTQPEIAKSLLNQVENKNLITLKGTTIVSSYALQTWGNENQGGEALLKYDTSRGWVLVSMGGGAWEVSSLVEFGVPKTIAEQIIAGRKK